MKKIKSPTCRKVRNAGFTPVWYRMHDKQRPCWVEKEGRKLLHVRFPTGELIKVPKSEQRYMEVIK